MKLLCNVNINRKTVIITEEQQRKIYEHLLLTEASLKEIYQKYYSNIPEDDFYKIMSADPTYDPTNNPDKMGKYGKWLLVQYKTGTMRIEDCETYRTTLDAFNRYNNRLQVRDIGKYKNEAEVYDAVKEFIETNAATSHSDEIRRAKAGAEKVYEDDEWLIIIPKTKEAAIYYGKNTRWCTAATTYQNMFDSHNQHGPLYINIDKRNNEKYQFHFETNQFKYSTNEDIEGIIADTIGLSNGAMDFYESLGPGKYAEICEVEHGEVHTLIENDEYRIILYYDREEMTIQDHTQAKEYQLDNYVFIDYSTGEPVKEPLYELFPKNIIDVIMDNWAYKNELLLLGYYNIDRHQYQGQGNTVSSKIKGNTIVVNINNDLQIFEYDKETYKTELLHDFKDCKYKLADDCSFFEVELHRTEFIGLTAGKEDGKLINTITHEILDINPYDITAIYRGHELTVRNGNDASYYVNIDNGKKILIPRLENTTANIYAVGGGRVPDFLAVQYDDHTMAIYSIKENRYVVNKAYKHVSEDKTDNGVYYALSDDKHIIEYIPEPSYWAEPGPSKNKQQEMHDLQNKICHEYGYGALYYKNEDAIVVKSNGDIIPAKQFYDSLGLTDDLNTLYDYYMERKREREEKSNNLY